MIVPDAFRQPQPRACRPPFVATCTRAGCDCKLTSDGMLHQQLHVAVAAAQHAQARSCRLLSIASGLEGSARADGAACQLEKNQTVFDDSGSREAV